MHLRSFKKGKKKYYFIAQTTRIGNKILQKSVLYLGSADSLYKKLIKMKGV